MERARELLAYVGLKAARFDRLATQLPYGDQRRVEIARALASEPRLLLPGRPGSKWKAAGAGAVCVETMTEPGP